MRCWVANGLLNIELEREIPEAMKPRQIAITVAPGSEARRAIDQKKAA